MPKIDDHPLRLARIRAGIGQQELASAIGAHRSTIAAIEEARTVSPSTQTLEAISRQLGLSSSQLEADITRWRTLRERSGPVLTPTGRATLDMSPVAVATLPSFAAWRTRLAPTVTAFATMLGVNRTVVANYERGIRERGMPDGLAHALVSTFGLSDEYLVALKRLTPSED